MCEEVQKKKKKPKKISTPSFSVKVAGFVSSRTRYIFPCETIWGGSKCRWQSRKQSSLCHHPQKKKKLKGLVKMVTLGSYLGEIGLS